jgi:hypothetical protein
MTRGDRYKQEANANLKKAAQFLKGVATILSKNQVKDTLKHLEVTKMISTCEILQNTLSEEVFSYSYRGLKFNGLKVKSKYRIVI